MADVLQTEFQFKLPVGYADEDGTLHREGTMRLATAADEILPMKDPRVQGNPAYLSVILLARVVTRLGHLEGLNTHTIESLYTVDFNYLQDLYNRINQVAGSSITCPHCNQSFEMESSSLGGA